MPNRSSTPARNDVSAARADGGMLPNTQGGSSHVATVPSMRYSSTTLCVCVHGVWCVCVCMVCAWCVVCVCVHGVCMVCVWGVYSV